MQKFSNMSLSAVASAAAPATMPAAGRVAVPTAEPASLSAEALNIPRSGIRDVFDRVERVPDAISLTVGGAQRHGRAAYRGSRLRGRTGWPHSVHQRAWHPRIPQGRGRLLRLCEGTYL